MVESDNEESIGGIYLVHGEGILEKLKVWDMQGISL